MTKIMMIVQMAVIGTLLLTRLAGAAETGCFLPADNWLVRVYSEGTGPYTFSMAVMNTSGALVPASTISAFAASSNPYLFENNANSASVSLSCDTINGTAYIFHDHAGQLTLTTIQNIINVPTEQPVLQVSANLLDYGPVFVGVNKGIDLIATNSGTADLHVTSVSSPLLPFKIMTDTCSTTPVVPAGTCTIRVRFTPTAVTAYTGSFTINSDGGNAAIQLQGSGK